MRAPSWLILGLPLGLLLLAPSPAPADAVRLDLDPERGVVLSSLPPILAEDEVRRHLTTGLTTTFLFRLEPQPREFAAGARVEVRYELWDEVFQVAVLTVDGRPKRIVVPSFDELASWWQQLSLLVMELEAQRTAEREVHVVLDVIPFSQAERDDTERWFSETIGAASRGDGEEADRSLDDRQESLVRVLSVMIATSIQRRALTSYEWTLELPGEHSP
ncbi:MAG: hypothetical protein GY769_24990 [bacterium]|nr:hypothetical protein [bacterium]